MGGQFRRALSSSAWRPTLFNCRFHAKGLTTRGMQMRQVRAGEDHAVHQQLQVAIRLIGDRFNLPFVAKGSRLLDQECAKSVFVLEPQCRSKPFLVVSISRHRA